LGRGSNVENLYIDVLYHHAKFGRNMCKNVHFYKEKTNILIPFFTDMQVISGKSLYERSQKWCTRVVSNSGNSVGSSASVQEGSTLKVIGLTQLQACLKKIIKK
jgi:hypothetical protein